MMRVKSLSIIFVFTLGLLLAGCAFQITRSVGASGGPPDYKPPTMVPVSLEPTPTGAADPENPDSEANQETGGIQCTDQLVFISDVTIPDGTVISPGSTLDKRWEVENAGTCNWDERYTLRLISGPEMGSESEQPLFPARAGTRPVIRVVFTAPEEQGRYRSAWQAFNPQDQPFGDLFYIEIIVGEPQS